jgi:hypothetical protein
VNTHLIEAYSQTEERIVARLALADIPGSEALFDKEAPVQNPEDGEEPDECP